MTSQYFNSFPTIQYNGLEAKNLTLSVKLSEQLLSGATNFYPYTIKDGETADSIAYDYYGDPNLVWLVFICNEIQDPFYDWFMNSEEFRNFIINKYGSEESARLTADHYEKEGPTWFVNNDGDFLPNIGTPPGGYDILKSDEVYKISPETYNNLEDKTGWVKVSQYDKELEDNELKRNIKLLDRRFISIVENNLRVLLNG